MCVSFFNSICNSGTGFADLDMSHFTELVPHCFQIRGQKNVCKIQQKKNNKTDDRHVEQAVNSDQIC